MSLKNITYILLIVISLSVFRSSQAEESLVAAETIEQSIQEKKGDYDNPYQELLNYAYQYAKFPKYYRGCEIEGNKFFETKERTCVSISPSGKPEHVEFDVNRAGQSPMTDAARDYIVEAESESFEARFDIRGDGTRWIHKAHLSFLKILDEDGKACWNVCKHEKVQHNGNRPQLDTRFGMVECFGGEKAHKEMEDWIAHIKVLEGAISKEEKANIELVVQSLIQELDEWSDGKRTIKPSLKYRHDLDEQRGKMLERYVRQEVQLGASTKTSDLTLEECLVILKHRQGQRPDFSLDGAA